MSSNQLLAAALLSSLGLGVGSFMGSRKNGSTALQGRKKQSKRVVSSGLGGMNPSKASDLLLRPPSLLNVPKAIPNNVPSIIAWDVVKFDSVLVATTGGVLETNFNFRFNQHPQQSSWGALFDQYCIPQATVEFDSAVPNGSTAIPVRLYTALDFDNSNAIGSVTAIEDFASCEVTPIVAGFRHMRSVRPCCKLSVSGVSGVTGSSCVQSWIDSADIDAFHFGIRSIIPASATAVVNVTVTIWFAFRNQI